MLHIALCAWRAVPRVTWYTDGGGVPGNRHTRLCCLEGSTPEEREGLFLFIALRWMQDPGGVMMWRAENIQACLRIFRRAQHQWLARDILHPSQGVYSVFVLHPVSASQSVLSVLSVVEQKSRGREPLSPGEGYRCGSRGAFLYCQRQLFCFLGAWKVLHGRTGSCAIGLLPRRVLSRDL